jgi:uncharacterized protein (TIGR02594 family)
MMRRVLPAGLNLREGPGTGFGVVRVMPRNTALVNLVSSGGWRHVRTFDGSVGWVAGGYTAADPAPWLTVARQEMQNGVAELAGARHHSRILEYHGTTTLRATSDEVPWCSSLANWCMVQVGILGTRLANARSWLQYGIPLAAPVRGCITVFSRGSDPQSGHVAFFLRRSGGKVSVLGGNQGNRICEADYDHDRVLGYRWPAGAPLPGVPTPVEPAV